MKEQTAFEGDLSGSIHPAKNAFYGGLTWLVPSVLTFVVTPIIVHRLGISHYGLYCLVLGAASALVGFASPSRTIIRYLASTDRSTLTAAASTIQTALTAATAVGTVIAASILLVARPAVSTFLRIPPDSRDLAVAALSLIALSVPLALASQILGAVAHGLQRFDLHSRIAVTMAAALMVGNGVLVMAGMGVLVLVSWTVLMASVAMVLYFRLAQRLLPALRPFPAFDRKSLEPHLGFTGGVLMSQLPGHLLLLIERTWIVRVLGTESLAYYVIPMTLGLSVHAGLSSLGLVLLPLATEALARGDLEGLERIYQRAAKFSAALVVLPVTMLVVAGELLLSLWMGPDVAGRSSLTLSLLACAFGLLALTIIPWHLAEALGRPRWNTLLSCIWLTINGALLWWLAPTSGIDGAAWARLAGVSVLPLYQAVLERSLFGRVMWSFWLRLVPRLAVAAALSTSAQIFLLRLLPPTWMGLGATLSAAGLVFLTALLATGYLSRDEKDWLRHRWTRTWSRRGDR